MVFHDYLQEKTPPFEQGDKVRLTDRSVRGSDNKAFKKGETSVIANITTIAGGGMDRFGKRDSRIDTYMITVKLDSGEIIYPSYWKLEKI
jgi:hypothetical protein